METWVALLISLAVGLLGGGGFVSLLKLRPEKEKISAEKEKIGAETDKIAAEGWAMLIQQMSVNSIAMLSRISGLETLLAEQITQGRADVRRIEDLERQIVTLNETLLKRDELIAELRAEVIGLRNRIMGVPE